LVKLTILWSFGHRFQTGLLAQYRTSAEVCRGVQEPECWSGLQPES